MMSIKRIYLQCFFLYLYLKPEIYMPNEIS